MSARVGNRVGPEPDSEGANHELATGELASPRSATTSHPYGALISALVIGALLWWFLRGVSLDGVTGAIRRASFPHVAAAMLVSLTGFAFRIVRWRYLLAPLKWTRLRSLAAAVFVGWALSAILPGRVGEVARAVLLRHREGMRASAAFGTIVLERLLDVFAILILVAASLGFVPAAALGSQEALLMAAIRASALVAFGAFVVAAVSILLMHHVPAVVSATVRRLLDRLPGTLGPVVWTKIEAFRAGLSGAVRGDVSANLTPGTLRGAVALHTALLWTMICGVHLLLLRAFGVDASVFSVPPLLFLITLGLSVPVPAGLGSYHTAVQLGLTAMLGVSKETAAGYAIVSHVVTLGPPTMIGLAVLTREGLALSTLASWPAATRSPDE
jgi:uncharacterized protein (TIRG00374 family)